MRMDVSRHGFAPKRLIQCQENLFWREDLVYFAAEIEQLRARALARTRVVAIQRHDFRVPSHTSIPPLCADELTAQPSSRSFHSRHREPL